MKKLLCSLIAAPFFFFSLSNASPSVKSLNSSLQDIGSEESYEEISALSGLSDKYATSYKSYLKRYKVTQKEQAIVARKFEEANIPLFFSLIPYCESNFRSHIHGAGTAGLWQFMAQSGRTYGLTIKKGNDERTDMCLSTDAAIRYIKDLKKEFGAWYLVDFAYGMGELKLQHLIKKNGSKKISVLLKDPEFPKGTKAHFGNTLLLDATIFHSVNEE